MTADQLMAGADEELIRVLVVEDDPLDAELVIEQLGSEKLRTQSHVVATAPEFQRALDAFDPDIVLCDLTLPGFSGYRALQLLRERDRRTPFVFVSGTMGEAAAIDALRAGATDYVLKNNLARLASVVTRALGEAAERRARDKVELELVRAQRFETLALLTGSLSHDLRNTLQPVLLATQLIESKAADPEVARLTAMIRDCCGQGLDLVSAMLDLARGGAAVGNGKTRRVKLAALLDAVGMMLRPSIPADVELVIGRVDPALEVPGSTTEFQQCLINLVLNAIQAMPRGGQVELDGHSRLLPADFYRESEPLIDGPCLVICVADTGLGMSAETLAKLFTPFFTTKEGGNGLGLVSCRRFVDGQRGFIRIISSENVGSRFELYLPLPVDKPANTEPVANLSATSPGTVGRRVAVLSDDAALVRDLGDILDLDGHEMLSPEDLGSTGPDPVTVALVDADVEAARLREWLSFMDGVADRSQLILIGERRSSIPASWSERVSAQVPKPVTARSVLGVLSELDEG